MTILELNKNVQAFDVEKELDKLILANEKEILATNKEQLYEYGVDSRGVPLGDYALKTQEYKQEAGQRYDHITLNDTGDFYQGFKIDIQDYEIGSTDSKANKLRAEYGDDIFGLTKENTAELTDNKLTPGLTKALNDTIKGI
jgi:hypothetical protein